MDEASAPLRFSGRLVVVTGACGGLGRAIATAFHGQGAELLLADLDGSKGAELAEQFGERARFLVHDVADEESWERLINQASDSAGRLDVLVNNAGVFTPNIPFEDMPLETWRAHFRVNSDGVFLGCKHALRAMKGDGQGGAIVNLGSGMSIKAVATASAYCASKAAVLMTTRTAALSGGSHGVRVNAILPGAVDTEMLRSNLRPGDDPADFFQRLTAGCALGALASAEDIARGALFLADPANRAITGIYLPVDGGNLVGA